MKKIALALLLGSVCYSSLLLATPPIKSAPSQQTIEQITQLAQKGDPTAQYLLGQRYFKGNGVSQDSKIAAEWFIKAGDQGNADAQFQLPFTTY